MQALSSCRDQMRATQINAAVQQAALLQTNSNQSLEADLPHPTATEGAKAADCTSGGTRVSGGAVAGSNAGVEALRLELSLMGKQLQKVRAELEQSRQAAAAREEEVERVRQELARCVPLCHPVH